jgi:hypothetical protein
MKLSWDIQKTRKNNRSKSLQAAWAIMSNEDVTVWYLVQRLNHFKPVKEKARQQMTLFTN